MASQATGTQREARPDQRDRLLQGFSSALREKGLQGTQISDIVRLARTSRRTFYECFADKESAFVELIRELGVELFATVSAAVDQDAPWDEQVDQAIDTYLAALEEDSALTATISHALPALGERGAEVQREGIDRFAGFLVTACSTPAARASGVEPVSADVALMLIGGISELIDRATHEQRPLSEVGPTVKAVIRAAARSG